VESSGRPAPNPARARIAWIAAAWASFGLATAALYAPLLGEDLREVVPSATFPTPGTAVTEWDRRFGVWLVARNAHAWSHHPWRLFDTGTCHPATGTLALGHPALSVGLLGVPGALATGDPVASFNLALVLQTLLAAFAMYLLVADWTGERAAGIVAGLGYAFLGGKSHLVTYPFHGDTAWTLLAFYFARRLFAGGGWRDALGLAASTALQLSASFYTALAAVAVGLPVAVWLFRAHGTSKLRPVPAATALLLVALAAWAVFSPFLAERGTALAARQSQIFASLPVLSSSLFGSLPVALLALSALALPRRLALPSSPRWALAAGAGLAAALASSGSLYSWLGAFVPGLDTVRVPLLVLSGLHLAWCALAGLGAAALLRSLGGRARLTTAVALITIVFIDVLRPPLPGLSPRTPFQTAQLRPPAQALAFYEELARTGNEGPIFEVSVARASPLRSLDLASRSVLLHAYHRRQTSACYNSFVPKAVRALGPLAQRLPEPSALRALTEQGFTTLVVEHPARGPRAFARRIARAADEGRGLVPILTHGGLSAYALLPASP
jgi:hypothetical protein